jgi:hypothetical protein
MWWRRVSMSFTRTAAIVIVEGLTHHIMDTAFCAVTVSGGPATTR